MSIEEFHVSVQSKGRNDLLFAALRLLNAADPVVVCRSEGEGPDGSWEPWTSA
jgi:hypothetical protein